MNAALNLIDGRQIRSRHAVAFDVVVVGSGPAGAAAAREIARGGARVAIVEEGELVAPEAMVEDSFAAMAALYRDLGASVTFGNLPIPYIQGRVVGGTSVINGAISWHLPRDVYDEWVQADPALADAMPWETLTAITEQIDADLNIHPTEPEISGRNNLLLGEAAEAFGLAHRPIARNVRGCRGLGRCLQGCPEGNKLSMDLSFLPDACAAGATLYSSVEVTGVRHRWGRATGVIGRAAGGGRVLIEAKRAVVLAASAIQTPVLLQRSGIHHGPLGENLQGHPGLSMAGRFPEPVRLWTGATQGHEVTGLRRERIKFEALGYDLALAASRLKPVGADFTRGIADLEHYASWGAALRATGRGRVRAGPAGPIVTFNVSAGDLRRARRSVAILGEMMLAVGADFVTPGIFGWQERVSDRATMKRFAVEGPIDATAYTMIVTHLFGTCRMGSHRRSNVVRPDFRHQSVDRLYVADSSVFPTNTGVNPQTSILALATLCGRRVLGEA